MGIKTFRPTTPSLRFTELSDFNYKPTLRAALSARMPPGPAAALRGSLAWREAWPPIPPRARPSAR